MKTLFHHILTAVAMTALAAGMALLLVISLGL